MMSQNVKPLLRSIVPFHALPDHVLEDLAAALEPPPVTPGAILIRAGDTSGSLYPIVSGCLRVTIAAGHGEELLAECGPGEVVGEIAFLTGERRSATIAAKAEASVLQLSRAAYDEIARKHPEIVAGLTAALAERL